MFGRLTIEALPLYSAIAASGAAMVVGGALLVAIVITWLKGWVYLWKEWLTSVDHKRIGVMYVILALIMLLRGFVDAIMMRAQQAMALNSGGYLPPEHFDQIFSSHGTIMIFFMAMPFMTGLLNIAVPLQIGTRDVAFPFLNSLSLWLAVVGRGAGHGVAGDRQVLDRRLDGLSALFGHPVQPGRRRRLLDLGAADQRRRLDPVGHQFRRHHHQAARAGHDPDAHDAVRVDGALHLRPDDLCLPRAHRGVRPAGARSPARHALLHQ